ncbi:hypothetical protein BGZ83_003691, partial [Gryganskiella cystojenkinii]
MAYAHLRRMRFSILLFAIATMIPVVMDRVYFLIDAKNPPSHVIYDTTMDAAYFCSILFPALVIPIYIYYLAAKREQEARQIELHRQAAEKSPPASTISYAQGYAVTTTTSSGGGLLTWVHWLRFMIVQVLAGYILYWYFHEWIINVQDAINRPEYSALSCKYAKSPSRCLTYQSMIWLASILGWVMVFEAMMTVWVASGVYWRRRQRGAKGGDKNHHGHQTAAVIVSPDQLIWQQQQQQSPFYPQQQQ